MLDVRAHTRCKFEGFSAPDLAAANATQILILFEGIHPSIVRLKTEF
jgi:hypothetical protein